MEFIQTLRECLATAQDRWRTCGEALKFGAVAVLLAVLVALLLLMGEGGVSMPFFEFTAFYGTPPPRIVVEADEEYDAWDKFWKEEIEPLYICEEVESLEGSGEG